MCSRTKTPSVSWKEYSSFGRLNLRPGISKGSNWDDEKHYLFLQDVKSAECPKWSRGHPKSFDGVQQNEFSCSLPISFLVVFWPTASRQRGRERGEEARDVEDSTAVRLVCHVQTGFLADSFWRGLSGRCPASVGWLRAIWRPLPDRVGSFFSESDPTVLAGANSLSQLRTTFFNQRLTAWPRQGWPE